VLGTGEITCVSAARPMQLTKEATAREDQFKITV
jgi:hypothetical protein